MHGNNLEQEINRILANMEDKEQETQAGDEPQTGGSQEEIIEETVEIFFIPAVRKDHTRIIDSEVAGAGVEDDQAMYFDDEPDTEVPDPLEIDEAERQAQRKSTQAGIATALFGLFLIFSSLAFQINLIFHPPTVTITLIPKSQEITLTTMLQLGRELTPITLSQSATAHASGKGHQDARQATGTITFYNGQLNSVFIPSGTSFIGRDGVQVVIDQDANIPAASPPTEGVLAVPAHAVNAGTQGNIPAKDINEACCATAVLAVNLTPFQGGQDERDYQFVTKSDIASAATPLEAALTQSVPAALQTQLKSNEQLQTLPCAPQVSADHHINEEAAQVKVTATLTCSGVAYNENTLQQQATQLLTHKAVQKLGSAYSLFGTIQVTVNRAIITHTIPTLVLSLSGTWTYALSNVAQQRIKELVKGKTYQEALHILLYLPGIESASLAWDENTKLPKDSQYIHLVLITGM